MPSSIHSILREFKTLYAENPDRYALQAVTAGNARIVLRPLQAGVPKESDLRLLLEWRAMHPRSFCTVFKPSIDSTRRWVETTIGDDPGRILFMALDDTGVPFGHLGLCGVDSEGTTAELDNILRGPGRVPGGMSAAVMRLCQWAREVLGIPQLFLRVFADNPAVQFYEKLGFKAVGWEALYAHMGADEVLRWLPLDATDGCTPSALHPDRAPNTEMPERSLLRMELP